MLEAEHFLLPELGSVSFDIRFSLITLTHNCQINLLPNLT